MPKLPSPEALLSHFDPASGGIDSRPMVTRHLADLRECFADPVAYSAALERGNPLVYSVTAVEPASGEGDLHYGLGVLMPGQVGNEYWMTKGHLHTWRPAAEFYIGLQGEGLLLLEDEHSRESQVVPLRPNGVVYVPGGTAHRTINTGSEPLRYLGVYPARAGHDYAAIAARNFRWVVLERNGRPVAVERTQMPKK